MQATAPYTPAIVVVAYNRPKALERLLRSVNRAYYEQNIPLVISIDRGGEPEVLQVAEAFEWVHGEKEVIYQEENLGLKEHVKRCGDLSEKYGAIIMLEDDLYVSPWFYDYSLKALNFYGSSEQVAGIALYNSRLNVHAQKLPFVSYKDGSDVFFSEMVCSWGQAWTWDMWKGFREWEKNYTGLIESTRLPQSIINWKDSSWVKIFAQYVREKQLFFVYPHTSYSTNFGEIGENFSEKETYFQVDLQMGRIEPRFATFEDSLSVYDIFYDILPEKLNHMAPHLAEYEYVVDLYGIKPLHLYKEPYVLTQMPVENPVMSFGRSLLPFEMNIIQGIEGNEIHLAKREEVMEHEYAWEDIFTFYYAHIPLKPLTKLTSRKLKKKTPFNLIFDKI